MKITLDIQDKNYSKFLELIGNLEYVSVSDDDEIPQSQIDEVSRRLDMIANGKMKTRSWEEAKREIFKRE